MSTPLKKAAMQLSTLLGREERAAELLHQATVLQDRLEEAFWCDDLSTYVLALDGDKRACRVRTSNAGHCLRRPLPAHGHRPAGTRPTCRTNPPGPGFILGLGRVRTVAATEARYNPMSYHNGSVWPHDNALVAYGMSLCGIKEGVLKIMDELFHASLFIDLHRLPELFCGFVRRPGEGPTLYPVACAPQSWSAASVFLLVQGCLGLDVKGAKAQVCFSYPCLPAFLKEMQIRNLRVGEGSVDLLLQRHAHDVGVNVLRREGHVEINVVK